MSTSICLWCHKGHNEEYSRYYCCEKHESYEYKKDEMETMENDMIKCPYCGYEYDDEIYEYYEEDEQTFECPHCEKEFQLSASVTWTFTATPFKEDVEVIVDEENEDVEE